MRAMASRFDRRFCDIAISVRVADVERDAQDRPRWKRGTDHELLRFTGTYDRRRKRWCTAGELRARRKVHRRPKRLVLRFHRGQEAAARWFADWLRRFKRGDWSNYKRAWSILLIGGRRSGKTHLACAALVLFAALNPGALVWAISPTLETGDELDEALKSIAPRSWYIRRQAKTGRSTTFTFANGSRILLKSAVKPERLKAGRVDLALLNEAQELSHAAYVKLRAPIADRGGLVMLAANPPDRPSGRWVEEHYIAAQAGTIESEVFELDPERNPFIKREALLSMAREIDEATYQRDVLGLFPPIGDIVFYQWSPRESVCGIPEGARNITAEVTKAQLGRAFERVIGIDLQQQPHMCAAVIEFFELAERPGDVLVWVVGEVVREEADEEDLIDGLEDAGYDAETSAIVMDASAWWQDGAHTKGKRSDAKFRARGWSWLYKPQKDSDRNPDIMVRVNCTRARLKSAEAPGSPSVRRMFSLPACERVNDAMRRWENRNGAPNRRSDYAHLCDAVTYPVFRFFGKPRPKKTKREYRGVGRFDRGEIYPR